MAEKRDYYEVLNVARTAGPEDVKRSYRRLALKHHPDNARGEQAKAEGEARFKELSEAYEVLSDPQKRQLYDRHGHQGLRGAGVHDFSHMGFGDIFSMFEDIFGGRMGGGQGGHQGYDLETEIELTLEEVAQGAQKSLEFERMDFCDACAGSGAKPGTAPARCNTCGGYGQVETGGGFFRMIRPCPACKGKGTIVSDPCPACRGSARQRKKRVLSVHVPAGVQQGQVIRLRGEGEPGEGGAMRGDLRCYIAVHEHPFFSRHGNDLVCVVPISFTQAALGAKIEIPTLSGKRAEEVPAGTQYGAALRIKQQGLPDQRSGKKGDLILQFLVEVPTRLSKSQRELLQQFAQTEEVDVLPGRKGFFEKLKKYFG